MIKINDAAFAAISPITFPLLAFFLNYNKKMPSHMFFLYFVIALPIPLHPRSEHSKKFRQPQYESGDGTFSAKAIKSPKQARYSSYFRTERSPNGWTSLLLPS